MSYESFKTQFFYLPAFALRVNQRFSPTRPDLETAPKGAA
jgi:hypothetical protein